MSQAPQFDHPLCGTHEPNALMDEYHCALHDEPSAAAEADPLEPSTIKILVVEDDRSSADILCLFFKMEGYDTACAYCGEDALLYIETKRPEIIFLDLGLPDINGYQVAAELRSLPGGENIHLVALTGRDEEEDRRNISAAGFDQHVVKPPLPAILREVIKKAEMR